MLALIASLLSVIGTSDSGVLKVDPLLVYQSAEAWKLIAAKDNPVWPGWNAADTPLLIYMPGVQDVLINHPKPPAGFIPYTGPVRFPGGIVLIKDGPTIERLDGQNTSREVNGIHTLMVADTLSSRRQALEGLVEQARGSSGEMKDAIDNVLHPDPLWGMAVFVHEAFHVYQHRKAPAKGGNEFALLDYPSLGIDNNVGFALEADLLKSALAARDVADVRKLAVQWLAIRKERRRALSSKLVDYEDGTEFNEGLAEYTQYRLLQALEGREPSGEMWLIQGFRGYADLSTDRQNLVNRMVAMMAGKANVNNDLYGASPVRMRLYYSGLGVAALLDRLGVHWHARILQPGTTLTGIAEEAIGATTPELQSALASLRASKAYSDLRADKQRLASDGQAYIDSIIKTSFDSAPGELVIDYSALTNPKVGFSFTPFGILRIDNDRTLFRLIPMSGEAGGMKFAEDSNRPTLQDRSKKQLVLSLSRETAESALDQLAPGWRTGPVKVGTLKLPGVELKDVDGRIRLDGRRVTISLIQR